MRTVLLIVPILLFLTVPVYAEERACCYTPEQLYDMSTLVFEGTVTKIDTVEATGDRFPVEADVHTLLKGALDTPRLSFGHKGRGKFVSYEQEFNHPEIGQRGTCYIHEQNGFLLLIGYLKKAEPQSSPERRTIKR